MYRILFLLFLTVAANAQWANFGGSVASRLRDNATIGANVTFQGNANMGQWLTFFNDAGTPTWDMNETGIGVTENPPAINADSLYLDIFASDSLKMNGRTVWIQDQTQNAENGRANIFALGNDDNAIWMLGDSSASGADDNLFVKAYLGHIYLETVGSTDYTYIRGKTPTLRMQDLNGSGNSAASVIRGVDSGDNIIWTFGDLTGSANDLIFQAASGHLILETQAGSGAKLFTKGTKYFRNEGETTDAAYWDIQFTEPTATYTWTVEHHTGTVPVVITKTTTGDTTGIAEGMIVINTFDNNVKIRAEGAWRTLASW